MTDDPSPNLTDRRRFLIGAGTAASIAGLGPVAAGQQTETPTGDGAETPAPGTETPSAQDSPIRPAFGYPAFSDQDPPVDPDHTVELLERTRGDRVEVIFQPTGLAVEPGDTVRFQSLSPWHTVTAYHPRFGYNQRIPDGAAAVNSPVLMDGMDFYYTFRTPGVYDLNCQIHEWSGMVVRIVNGEASGPGADSIEQVPPGAPGPDPLPGAGEPTEEPPTIPPYGAARTVLSDPALAPETILERGTVRWQEISQEARATPTPTPEPAPTTEGTPAGNDSENV